MPTLLPPRGGAVVGRIYFVDLLVGWLKCCVHSFVMLVVTSEKGKKKLA